MAPHSCNEPRFRALSETEWASIWNHIKAASGEAPLPNEARIRKQVDVSALLSGYFFDFVEFGSYKQTYLQHAKRSRKFLEETKSFISAAVEFFGEPDNSSSDTYDPWPERKILGELENLRVHVKRTIWIDERSAREAEPAPPNTAKPERDKWMAGLILVWTEGCKLPSKNSKHLRGFIMDALRPYQTGTVTERMAEQFIERWNCGKIPRPSRGPVGGMFDP